MSDARLRDIEKWMAPPKGGLWHGGPGALSALRGVGHEEAAWKLAEDRHSIWELTLHIAYWKYAVRNRVLGGARGGFPRHPSDWPAQPSDPTAKAWKADRDLLKSEHEALLELLRAFDPSRLDEPWGGAGKWSYMDLLSGVVLHDTYHLGQIQLMKRLFRSMRA